MSDLAVEDNNVDRICDGISTTANLALDATKCRMSRSFQRINTALQRNRNIKSLALGLIKRAFPSADLSSFGALSCLDVKAFQFDVVGLTTISQTLKKTRCLRKLSITRCEIDQSGAVLLSSGLEVNKSLESLILNENNVGDDGARSICRALTVGNKTLSTFSLATNGIGPDGMSSVVEMMEGNKSLTFLNVGNNKIGNCGVATLCRALKVNKSIAKLNIESNGISQEGALQLIDVLAQNKNVVELYLFGNTIDEEGAKLFVERISSTNLFYVDLRKEGQLVTVSNALKEKASLCRISSWIDFADRIHHSGSRDDYKTLSEIVETITLEDFAKYICNQRFSLAGKDFCMFHSVIDANRDDLLEVLLDNEETLVPLIWFGEPNALERAKSLNRVNMVERITTVWNNRTQRLHLADLCARVQEQNARIEQLSKALSEEQNNVKDLQEDNNLKDMALREIAEKGMIIN